MLLPFSEEPILLRLLLLEELSHRGEGVVLVPGCLVGDDLGVEVAGIVLHREEGLRGGVVLGRLEEDVAPLL
eukprot:15048609-Alexandrium_andersonii.AAC.1